MALEHRTDIALPAHRQPGGVGHAAVHRASARLYVAHTTNDALDVIDCARDRYLDSIAGLTGVAGALVSDARPLVFTANRGEHTVGIFAPDAEEALGKVPVGIGPNGLAHDPGRNLLLAANVGDPQQPGSHTVALLDVDTRALVASGAVPGRTRWTVFDPRQEVFFVNITDPPQIVVIEARHPTPIARVYEGPAARPHGLDPDGAQGRLFCACDAGRLVCLEAHAGRVLDERQLSGVPDVICLHAGLAHLYVAIGDPGVIDAFDSSTLERVETVATARGAHTMVFDGDRNKGCVFLPQAHRAAVDVDTGGCRCEARFRADAGLTRARSIGDTCALMRFVIVRHASAGHPLAETCADPVEHGRLEPCRRHHPRALETTTVLPARGRSTRDRDDAPATDTCMAA